MSIFLKPLAEGLKDISEHKVKITVIGAGTVGLPLATFFAKNGFHTVAYDVNEARVQSINRGDVPFEYRKLLEDVVSGGLLKATRVSKDAIEGADFVLICVPTPINQEKHINLSYLKRAGEDISRHLSSGAVVVLESSVSIGATRELKTWIESQSHMKAGQDFGVAYCPERYNPGLATEKHPHIVYETEDSGSPLTYDKVGRVLGGLDEKSLRLTEALYSSMLKVPLCTVSSLETAEATKLLENIFRDVNIGLVNELSQIYSRLGVDIYEVIGAAESKPFAFLPHWPGCGVGGECIPVDTWYLIKQAEAANINPKLLKAAREVNDAMPRYTIDLLEEVAGRAGFALKGSKVLVLGLAYKQNVIDDRLSPAYEIVRALEAKGAEAVVCDPLVERYGQPKVPLASLPQCFDGVHAVILATGHDVFKAIDFAAVKARMKYPVVIDGRKFYDGAALTSLGFMYRSIGQSMKEV